MLDRKEYLREYSRNRRERLKKARLCVDCERPLADADTVRCQKCREHHANTAREWARERRAQAIDAGLCYTCGRPLEDNTFARCKKCRGEHLKKYCKKAAN